MELQRIIVLCVVLVVLGGALWYFTADRNSEQPSEATSENVDPSTQTPLIDDLDSSKLSGVGSLADLLGLGNSIVCTYTYSDETGETEGVGYFSNGRMRVDANYSGDENSFDSHIINDGENLYSWSISEEGTYAFVTPVTAFEAEDADTSMPSGENPGVDAINEDVTYECDNWRADASVFAPPEDVEFVDMSAMFEGMIQNMPEEMRTNMGTFEN